MDYSDYYWLVLLGGAGLAKFGKWIRKRSEETSSASTSPTTKPSGTAEDIKLKSARRAPVARPLPSTGQRSGRSEMAPYAIPKAKPAIPPLRSAPEVADSPEAIPEGRIQAFLAGALANLQQAQSDAKEQVGQRPGARRTGATPPPRNAPPVRRQDVAGRPQSKPLQARPTRAARRRSRSREEVVQVTTIPIPETRRPTRKEPPAEKADESPGKGLVNPSIQELRRAILWREILGPPVSLRKPDDSPW